MKKSLLSVLLLVSVSGGLYAAERGAKQALVAIKTTKEYQDYIEAQRTTFHGEVSVLQDKIEAKGQRILELENEIAKYKRSAARQTLR